MSTTVAPRSRAAWRVLAGTTATVVGAGAIVLADTAVTRLAPAARSWRSRS